MFFLFELIIHINNTIPKYLQTDRNLFVLVLYLTGDVGTFGTLLSKHTLIHMAVYINTVISTGLILYIYVRPYFGYFVFLSKIIIHRLLVLANLCRFKENCRKH